MDKLTEQLERNLRQKFVRISFSVVFVVLLVIFLLVNSFNYVQVSRQAKEMMNLIFSYGGTLPRPEESSYSTEEGETPQNPAGGERPQSSLGETHKHTGGESPQTDTGESLSEQGNPEQRQQFHLFQPISPSECQEIFFTTRFFTVTFNGAGEIIAVDTSNVQRVNPPQAVELAEEIQGEDEGYSDFYYYYQNIQASGDVMYVFLDVSQDLYFFQSFLYSSLWIFVFSLLGVLLLLVSMSKTAVSPIVEAYARQKRFITEMSHELKTPLAVVKANAEVLELEHGASPWTGSIHKQIEKLNYLIIRLLSLAKLEESSTRDSWKEFSFSQMVCEAGESISVLLNQQGKSLELLVEENISFTGDAPGMLQLLDILLENASKYSLPQTAITLRLYRGKHSLFLTVENQVDSLKKGHHDQWFQRFYREESSRNSATGGFGLGLSMAKTLVKNHEGKISVYSSGNSVTVKVEFRLQGSGGKQSTSSSSSLL